MVTPDRRRIAVERIQQRFGVSERWACAVLGQHRSTQRRPKAPPDDAEAELREHLRDFARCHSRLGWRKDHVVGTCANYKRRGQRLGPEGVWNGFREILERFLAESTKVQVRSGAGTAGPPVVATGWICPFDMGVRTPVEQLGIVCRMAVLV